MNRRFISNRRRPNRHRRASPPPRPHRPSRARSPSCRPISRPFRGWMRSPPSTRLAPTRRSRSPSLTRRRWRTSRSRRQPNGTPRCPKPRRRSCLRRRMTDSDSRSWSSFRRRGKSKRRRRTRPNRSPTQCSATCQRWRPTSRALRLPRSSQRRWPSCICSRASATKRWPSIGNCCRETRRTRACVTASSRSRAGPFRASAWRPSPRMSSSRR